MFIFDVDISYTYVADNDSHTCYEKDIFFPMSIYSHKTNLVSVQKYQWAYTPPKVPNSWLTQSGHRGTT